MSDSKEYYHNEGEQDASKDEYNPPHGFESLLSPPSFSEKIVEENQAYKKGWRNTKDEKEKKDSWF